jgi:hypothetical protein
MNKSIKENDGPDVDASGNGNLQAADYHVLLPGYRI